MTPRQWASRSRVDETQPTTRQAIIVRRMAFMRPPRQCHYCMLPRTLLQEVIGLVSGPTSGGEKIANHIRELRSPKVPIAAVLVVLTCAIDVLITDQNIVHSDATGGWRIVIGQTAVQSHLITRISQVRPLLDLLGNGGL